MKRIIFVDDEPAILGGIRNRLRRMRAQWEMSFAASGREALAELSRRPFDVVVSDMRMPGMDGAELLGRVRDLSPGTVRIVLSGHAEREAVLRVLPVAHQYLSKPCDADVLCRVIEQCSLHQELLGDPRLRAIVGRVEKLPSVPRLYAELSRILASNASTTQVAHVIESDPAMCSKIMHVINSAFFGLARRVTEVGEALVYLGLEPLKTLVLASQIFAEADGVAGLPATLLVTMQEHSTRVARLARAIAPAHKSEAFMAGMLHDVGQLVLAMADGEAYAEIRGEAAARRVPLEVAEHERLGVSHAQVGGYVLGTWGVPTEVVRAVAGNHELERYGGTTFDTTAVVHVADALDSERWGELDSAMDEAHLDRLGVLAEVAGWRAMAVQLDDQKGTRGARLPTGDVRAQ
jgi:HD-like signal output (HDOD) protein